MEEISSEKMKDKIIMEEISTKQLNDIAKCMKTK